MSSPPTNSTTKASSVPNIQLSSKLYALLRSEKPQGPTPVTVGAATAPSTLGGYSGLPSLFGHGQTHPLVAAAAQAALSSGGSGQELQVQKFEDIQSSLNQLRRYADSLPGGHYSPEEQIRYMDVLREQIRAKSDLLKNLKRAGAAGILEQSLSGSATINTD